MSKVREVPLSGPDIRQSDIDAVLDVLKTRRLALGPKMIEFERKLASVAGRDYAVAVNSGTSGLHLALLALGIGPGDEVITSPFSFVASANCVLMVGARPVFVDIEEPSFNISIGAVKAVVEKRKPKAVLVVDVFGQPSDWSDLEDFCARHGTALIEDSCEAIGAVVGGRPAGGFGRLGVFAFYPNKQITTGEGGAIVTDERETADLCRSLRNQGRDEGGGWLQHRRLGYNYRLSELNCALGIAQLGRLDEIMRRRGQVAGRYSELLSGVDGVRIPVISEDVDKMSWFVYVLRLDDSYSRRDRDAILREMRRRGVGCSNYFAPIHLMPFYREMGFSGGDFPVTEAVADRTIALPFYSSLSGDDQEYAVEVLKSLL